MSVRVAMMSCLLAAAVAQWAVSAEGVQPVSTGRAQPVPTEGAETGFIICKTGDPREPAIDGNIVVWEDSRNAATTGPDICGYDLATRREFPVCTAPGRQRRPAISGNTVVWEDRRDYPTTGWDIYGCDLTTRREFAVCTAPGNQDSPAISGNTVCWADRRNQSESSCDIYGHDLETGREFPVCTAQGHQSYPAISGGIIVWRDLRDAAGGGQYHIYSYDLATGK